MKYKISIILLNDNHSKEIDIVRLEQYSLNFVNSTEFHFSNNVVGVFHSIHINKDNYVYIYCDVKG